MTQAAHPIRLTINGETVAWQARPRLLLSELLRDGLGLTGTHVGCGTGVCGSCTVLLDGQPVRACLLLAVQADGSSVETIESVGESAGESAGGAGRLHPVQEAFQAHHALQCGFCTPGIVMSAVALFRATPRPDRAAIETLLEGHLCRCTGYRNIAAALASVAESGACGGAGSYGASRRAASTGEES